MFDLEIERRQLPNDVHGFFNLKWKQGEGF